MTNFNNSFNQGSITNIDGAPLFIQIKKYLNESSGPLYIICPFVTNQTIVELLSESFGKKITIITSWRPDHLLSGVSSIELYNICKENHWTLFVNSRIHCKIYSNSFNTCVVTSANCTYNALVRDKGNIENCVLLSELNVGNRVELNKIVAESTLVTEIIYQKYKKWLNSIEDSNFNAPCIDIEDSSHFHTFQLPATDNPSIMWQYILNPEQFKDKAGEIEHDIAIYSTSATAITDYESFMADVKKVFQNHPFIKLLDDNITSGGIRFGAFKCLIQDNCSDVPVPFRKDLTIMAHNLYEWFVILFPEKYYWDVPGSHSQVLHRHH
ncbi:MAG: phospholipase D family protein [Candidatus Methanomethylophilaceae archaeon]|nr:phospholipase D family protein [Candidatus Methanomethylophilaceae archaeon]